MTDKFTSHLGQKFRGGYCSGTWSNSSQALFTSPRSVIFISSFTGRPRIFFYPQTGYWAWPFFMQFEHRVSIGPHNWYFNSKSWDVKLFNFFFFFFLFLGFHFWLNVKLLNSFHDLAAQVMNINYYLLLFCFSKSLWYSFYLLNKLLSYSFVYSIKPFFLFFTLLDGLPVLPKAPRFLDLTTI